MPTSLLAYAATMWMWLCTTLIISISKEKWKQSRTYKYTTEFLGCLLQNFKNITMFISVILVPNI